MVSRTKLIVQIILVAVILTSGYFLAQKQYINAKVPLIFDNDRGLFAEKKVFEPSYINSKLQFAEPISTNLNIANDMNVHNFSGNKLTYSKQTEPVSEATTHHAKQKQYSDD